MGMASSINFTDFSKLTVIELDVFEENDGGLEANVPLRLSLVGDEGEKVPRVLNIPFIKFDALLFPFTYLHV